MEAFRLNLNTVLDDSTGRWTSRRIQQPFIDTMEGIAGDKGKPGFASMIINNAGGHLGKSEPPVSLSTYLINPVEAGHNAYIYDTVVRAGEDPDSEAGLILIAALALHDVNKYVEQEYETDFDTSQKSTELLTTIMRQEMTSDFGT